MLTNGPDHQASQEPLPSKGNDDLVKEARQLGAEVLALVKARFSSSALVRTFVNEMTQSLVSGLDSPKSTLSVPQSNGPMTSATTQNTRITDWREAKRSDAFGPSNPRTVRIETIYEPDNERGGYEVVFESDSNGLSGRTGDHVALCPRNDPDEVRQLLRAFGMRGVETVLCGRKSGPAWRVLLEDVDISRISEAFREELCTRIVRDDKNLLIDEYIRSSCPSLVGLLRRFPSLGKCFDEFVNCANPLVPEFGFVAEAFGERESQLKVLLSDTAYRAVKNAKVALKVGGWVPVYIERRVESHLSDNGELPLVVFSDPLGAHLARSYVLERQKLGHRGRSWVIVFGSGLNGNLREQFEGWIQSGKVTRFDWSPELLDDGQAPSNVSSSMLWRWFVDRSAFYIVGSDSVATKRIERSVLALLVDGSGKSSDWFREPLVERRNDELYRIVSMG